MPAVIDEAALRVAPVPYLVIRCGPVPKVGTVPLLDLKFKLNISLI